MTVRVVYHDQRPPLVVLLLVFGFGLATSCAILLIWSQFHTHTPKAT